MPTIKSNHPEFSKIGKLDLTSWPSRVDYTLNTQLSQEQAKNSQLKSTLEKKGIEILNQTMADGVPLTKSHKWQMHVSSDNPHGWGAGQSSVYFTGLKSTPAPSTDQSDPTSVQESMSKNNLIKLINECVSEVINEMSTDASNEAFTKLVRYMEKYPSFIPDAITYMKDKADTTRFDVVAREVAEKQYLPLLKSLDQRAAEMTVNKVKDLYIKFLNDGLRSGKWKTDAMAQKSVKDALQKINQKTGDTGFVYKSGQMQKESDLGVDPSLPEPKRRKAASKELMSLKKPGDRYQSVLELARNVANILDKWGFDSEQLRRKYVSNDMEPDVLFGQGGSVNLTDAFRVGDRTSLSFSVYKDTGWNSFEVVFYIS